MNKHVVPIKTTVPLKTARLFIGVPSHPTWCAEFGMHMLSLMACMHRPFPGLALQHQFSNVRGSILSQLRQQLVEQAQGIKATHILMLDSDMAFPPEIAQEWIMYDKDVIAANCMTKSMPAAPTARLYDGTSTGKKLYCDPDLGLQKVWRVGTGVMMIKMSVFDRIKKPWFPITWKEESQTYQGEDWGFAELCEQAGIDLWVDQEASAAVGHIGSFQFTHHHVLVEEPLVQIPGADENNTVKLEIVKR